jgi:hypothetical protein
VKLAAASPDTPILHEKMSAGGALDHEWAILLAAASVTSAEQKQARLRSLLQQPVRWSSLFSLADHHGVQPLLYEGLAPIARELPAEEVEFLRQSHQANLHKALLLSRELIRIVDHLSELGIEAMPYKGLALAELVYGDIALRQSGDIDLLVRPEDFRRVRDAVSKLGYIPHDVFSGAKERAQLRSGYECAFDGDAGPNLLEVQWAIQPRFYAIDFDMAGLFKRATTVVVAGQPMKTPCAEDLFLVLSAHAAKHVWGRLIWLCDLARIMSLPSLNWAGIRSQAQALGIERILRITVLAANRMLGTAIPPAAEEVNLTASGPATLALVDRLQSFVKSEAPFNVESPAYFRLMMRLRERASDRRRFLTRLVFTPGPSEWAAVRLPEPLFPLYRLVRLSRLAARLVRR